MNSLSRPSNTTTRAIQLDPIPDDSAFLPWSPPTTIDFAETGEATFDFLTSGKFTYQQASEYGNQVLRTRREVPFIEDWNSVYLENLGISIGTIAERFITFRFTPHQLRASTRATLHAPTQVRRALETVRSLGVNILQAPAVELYLSKHPDTIELLLGLCKSAASHFGVSARLSLQACHDPEANYQHLFLVVQPKTRGPEVRQAIEKISAAFDDELSNVSGFVLIKLDYTH